MAQLTIYLDESLMRKIEKAAAEEQQSVSRWTREKLETALSQEWPAFYFNLIGYLEDTEWEEPESLNFELDSPREKL